MSTTTTAWILGVSGLVFLILLQTARADQSPRSDSRIVHSSSQGR